MRWVWDQNKNRLNIDKHGLSFETAQLVLSDPLAVSRPDPSSDEERWQTIGMIAQVILFVVHTLPAEGPQSDDEVGRIISARKATPQERKAYEEGEF